MSYLVALFLLAGTSLDEEAWMHSHMRSPHGARCVPCERPTSLTYPRRGTWACSSDGKKYTPVDIARACVQRGAP